MNYPVYQPTYTHSTFSSYSSYSTSGTAATSYPTVTPVGARAPRMLGGSQGGFAPLSDDEDDFLDWGEGDGESSGGTIVNPNGQHGGEASPIGDVCWPLLLCLGIYLLRHMYLSRRV